MSNVINRLDISVPQDSSAPDYWKIYNRRLCADRSFPEVADEVLTTIAVFESLTKDEFTELVKAFDEVHRGRGGSEFFRAYSNAWDAARKEWGQEFVWATNGFLSGTCNDAWNPEWTKDVDKVWNLMFAAASAIFTKPFIGIDDFTGADYDLMVYPWVSVMGKTADLIKK